MADRKLRILVVDDANLVRLYYRQILEEAGFEVEEALNGLEALERLLAIPADAVIVDINMPLMDGVTFLSALRRQALPSSPSPPGPTARPPAPSPKAADIEAARAAKRQFLLLLSRLALRGSRAHTGDVLRRSPDERVSRTVCSGGARTHRAGHMAEPSRRGIGARSRRPRRALKMGLFQCVSDTLKGMALRHRRLRSDGTRDARRRGCPVDGSPG